jgi:hypothetical protein
MGLRHSTTKSLNAPGCPCAAASTNGAWRCSKCDAYSKLDTTNGWFNQVTSAFKNEPFCDGLCMRNTQYGALTEVRSYDAPCSIPRTAALLSICRLVTVVQVPLIPDYNFE